MAADNDFSDLYDLIDKIQSLTSGTEFETVLLVAGERVGAKAVQLLGEVPEVPNPRPPLPLFYTLNGRKSKFKTVKQRGWYFAALRDGTIKVPYIRTNNIRRTITEKPFLEGDQLIVQVGTNAPGAQYVIGPDDIANHYLRSLGWQAMTTTISRNLDELVIVFRTEIVYQINARLE